MSATPPICSYPKCTCKGFKSPKWGGNECAICFHFQEKHSDQASTATPTPAPAPAATTASPASPGPTTNRTLTAAASFSSRTSSPAARPSGGSVTSTKPAESKAPNRPSFVRTSKTHAPPEAKAEPKVEPTKPAAAEALKAHHQTHEAEKVPEQKPAPPPPAAAAKEEHKSPAPPPSKEEPKKLVPASTSVENNKPSPKGPSAPPVAAAPAPVAPPAAAEPEKVAESVPKVEVEVVAAADEHNEEYTQATPSRMRLSSNIPEANFAKNLPHMFPLVSKQVGMGLYGVKRIATTLKEVCAYQKGCPSVEAMIRDSENRTAVHRHAEGHDDMQMLFQYASSAILGTLGQYISKAHSNFLSKVDNEAASLLSFYTSSERIRASLIEEARKAEAVVTNATHSLTKERESVSKMYTQLQTKKQAIVKMGEDERKKKGPNEEKAYYALRQKVAEVFAVYEKQVEETAEMQKKYYDGKLPQIMTELEALEKSRLQMLNDKFTIYNRMLQEHIDEITAIRDSIQLIPPTLDPDRAMVDFVETVTSRLGHATPTLFAYYDFHVTSEDVLTEPIDDSAAPSPIAGAGTAAKAGEALAALSGKYNTAPATKSGIFGGGAGSRAKRALMSKTFKKEAFDQAHAEAAKESSSATTAAPVATDAGGENQLPAGTVVIAQFEYKSGAPEELQFNAGDSITVSQSVGTWWSGRLNGQGPELAFPYNFVAVESKVNCVAMFDFAPGPELENPEEYLTFKVGDIIEATSSTDAWWHGTCNGRQGYFPFAFTQLK